jgi:hypothetical protein
MSMHPGLAMHYSWSFVRGVEQDRLLGGSGASVQLDDRFRLLVLLLRPSRGALTALSLGGSIDFPPPVIRGFRDI